MRINIELYYCAALENLFIQIPCFNEAEQIKAFLDSIPRSLPGIGKVTIVVINDGSTDETRNIAKANGVDYVIDFATNRGLSQAFQSGIRFCLSKGADIIVNTDADDQYPATYIQRLIEPVLMGKADFAIGDRQTRKVKEFSFLKRRLQSLGSSLASKLSGLEIHDAASGFRAYSREAAAALNVTNKYTYTLETLVQLGSARMCLANVPIETNPAVRPSRLFKSNIQYVKRNGSVLARTYIQYAPLRFFSRIALIMVGLGFLLMIPTLDTILLHEGVRHLQSLIASAICLTTAVQILGIGFVADAIRSLRSTLKNEINAESPRVLSDETREGVN